jgi:protein-S-isoprenylcysteine O-methyltransferase Ste14
MTALQSEISFVVLILLFAMIACRAILLRRKGVRAMVFGKTDRRDFLLLVVVALLVYPAIAEAAGLPMWSPLVKPFWENAAPGWIGIAVCILALAGVIATLASFGDAFRVGIDEEKPDKLMTGGMFAISRNPLYLCMILFFIGFFLVHRNIVAAAVVVFLFFATRQQILREEKFLKKCYGSEYEAYQAKTRRYI